MWRACWCWTAGLVSAAIVAEPPAPLAARDPWVEPVRRTVVRIEAQKPSFADANVGFTTGLLYTTAAVRLSDRLQLALELPIANFSPDNGGDGSCGSAIRSSA